MDTLKYSLPTLVLLIAFSAFAGDEVTLSDSIGSYTSQTDISGTTYSTDTEGHAVSSTDITGITRTYITTNEGTRLVTSSTDIAGITHVTVSD